jgi:hypothetical protein
MVDNNFPESNVSGTLRVPPANGTRSVPDTFTPPQFLIRGYFGWLGISSRPNVDFSVSG